MARSSPILTAFIAAMKQQPVPEPWNVLPKQIPYEEQRHKHSLRKTTMPVTVQLCGPILNAITMYVGATAMTPFRLVQRRIPMSDSVCQYIVEAGLLDGSSLVVSTTSERVRISHIETDGTRSPIQAFRNESDTTLTATMLAILPHVLELDQGSASGVLSATCNSIADDLVDTSSWTGPNEIPEAAKDHAYFTDIILDILKNSMEIDFGTASSNSAEEIDDSCFANPEAMTGALVAECLPNGWEPMIVKSNGRRAMQNSGAVTMAEAIAAYSSYTAHRQWTAKERMMIPKFPDDTPVMEEALRFAKRIVNTHEDKNPVLNFMWRGVTAYGKSTGTRQLAAILNIPLLVITCHPAMEVGEFKSNLVPVSTEDTLELDLSNVTLAEQNNGERERPPFYEEAMAHLASMDEAERSSLLDPKTFFYSSSMDTDGTALALIGSEVSTDSETLNQLYCEIIASSREMPLQNKIKRLEAAGNAEKQDSTMQFKHVISPYTLALVNGYMVEIQEPSRIRSSGVLVGLNGYDRPGSVIDLMNGAKATRHADALVMTTDNVGYVSCNPIDPSFIRRQDMVIDSYELTKEMVIDRVKRNVGCKDMMLLETAYELWLCVKTFCEQNSITDGSVSPMELERFVQAVHYDGMDSIPVNLDDCIISKATSSIEDQRDIRTACTTILTNVRVA